MAKQSKTTKTKKITKKEAKQQIYDKLLSVLSEYKNGSGDKKFDRDLQKASKMFAPYLIKERPGKKN